MSKVFFLDSFVVKHVKIILPWEIYLLQAELKWITQLKMTVKEEFSATPQLAEVSSLARKGTMC